MAVCRIAFCPRAGMLCGSEERPIAVGKRPQTQRLSHQEFLLGEGEYRLAESAVADRPFGPLASGLQLLDLVDGLFELAECLLAGPLDGGKDFALHQLADAIK